MESRDLKERVREYWNSQPCGSTTASSPMHTRAYYDEVEEHRYRVEPEILSFAQFTRFHGQKVLEVGVGLGTDFLQWVRAGAEAHGLDLTEEAVSHAKRRLDLYGLQAESIQSGDAEHLPFESGYFDLVYSW